MNKNVRRRGTHFRCDEGGILRQGKESGKGVRVGEEGDGDVSEVLLSLLLFFM